jgi:inhibitor of cysteine peptidase
MKRMYLVAVLIVVLTACGTSSFDDASSGDTADLRVGELFDLSLETNPSTGFDWFIVEGTDSIVRQVGAATYLARSDDGNLVGAGGTLHFEFEAIEEGTTTLVLHYKRSWEDAAPERTFELEVTVTP